MSERRASRTGGITRSTLRYRPVARDDIGVITFIQEYRALNTRHGFRPLYDGARHQLHPLGKTVALARALSAAAEPAPASQVAATCAHETTPQAGPTQPSMDLRLGG